MQRYLKQIDCNTGEVMDGGTLVYMPQRIRLREGWFMTFQESLVELAKDREITGRSWRVLAILMAKLDFENYIHISQAQIADELELQPSNVSQAIAKLIKKGVILRGPRVGRVATFRLSPSIGWKGRVTNLQQARKRHLTMIAGKRSTESDRTKK